MKVLISANTSWYVWNFRKRLIDEIRAQGHTVIVAAPADSYSAKFGEEGIDFVPVSIRAKSTNPLGELATFCSYMSVYRAERPDIILQYTIKPNLYGSIAARFLGIPAVCNVSGLGAAFARKGLLSFIVVRLYRFAFRKVHRVFFQNPDDRALFLEQRLVREERTALLPGSGVNLERFTPEPRESGPFTFLFVGRLLKAKGVEDFIRAARIVRAEGFPDTRFVLLGAYDDDDSHMADRALIDGAVSDGVVILPGQVDDVRVWLRKADCVALPSYYREGVPRSLLEGAASGKILIAADSVGTKEPVTNGLNGFLCRPRDPADLARAMKQALSLTAEQRDAMGRNSRTIAETRFDERIVLLAYLDILSSFAIH
jgi:glycosyltransferase involved in cell wall biosynthesis